MERAALKIVFFGAGAFAPPVLDAILKDERLNVFRIVTQPDKPAGRKGILTPSPLGKWCETAGIAFERCPSVNDPDFLQSLRAQKPDLAVVVSFGQLLKEELLELPRLGCLNVHASLLPEYRGASPIVSSILNGEKETGVSFMKMDKGLDTGPVYQQFSYEINETITAPELENQLASLAGSRIGDCIMALADGTVSIVPQDGSKATISKKIRKSHASIDWTVTAHDLACKVRAFQPWPSAVFIYPGSKRNMTVKISSAKQQTDSSDTAAQPGTVLHISREGIDVVCGKGILQLKRVIPEGKKEMDAFDFANGFRMEPGITFLNGPTMEK